MRCNVKICLHLLFAFTAISCFSQTPDSSRKVPTVPTVATTALEIPNRDLHEYVYKKFPHDTLQVFIKNYGKDSLLHLLNLNIEESKKLISSFNFKTLQSEILQKDLKTFSKHYHIGIDTMFMLSMRDSLRPFNKLYGVYPFDLSELGRKIDSAVQAGASSGDLSEKVYKDFMAEKMKDTRAILSTFCEKLPPINKLLDTLCSRAQKLNWDERLQWYLAFADISKNCGDKDITATADRDSLFASLYKENNLEKILEYNDAHKDGKVKFVQPVYRSLQLLAYGLYGGNVSLSEHGKDLMYTLSFKEINQFWDYGDIGDMSTFYYPYPYRLWIFLELRDKLK